MVAITLFSCIFLLTKECLIPPKNEFRLVSPQTDQCWWIQAPTQYPLGLITLTYRTTKCAVFASSKGRQGISKLRSYERPKFAVEPMVKSKSQAPDCPRCQYQNTKFSHSERSRRISTKTLRRWRFFGCAQNDINQLGHSEFGHASY